MHTLYVHTYIHTYTKPEKRATQDSKLVLAHSKAVFHTLVRHAADLADLSSFQEKCRGVVETHQGLDITDRDLEVRMT